MSQENFKCPACKNAIVRVTDKALSDGPEWVPTEHGHNDDCRLKPPE